ncbi:hypothetical protein NE865_00364 [Phthorimaea operculella]|nr:hypothetical protein NE865_00364 [Phthorimaea operculella]
MSSPKIWSRFVGKRKSDGAECKFVVRDATAEDREAVLDFLEKYMTPNEAFYKAAGICKSEEAMKEHRSMNGEYFNASHCMICYEDKESDANATNPIVGINLVSLDEGQFDNMLPEIIAQIKTPEVKKLFKIVTVNGERYSARKNLGLDKYYSGWGVCVRPDFAGFGVAKELLSLRRALCKANGVPATGAWMTAVGSQKAAERDGWKTVFEISFEEVGRLTDCEFVGGPPTVKFMVAYADK